MAVLRLFVGLFPPAEVADSIARTIENWKETLPDPRLRWVPIENLHLTLSFLGNVDESQIRELVKALRVAVGESVNNDPGGITESSAGLSEVSESRSFGTTPRVSQPRESRTLEGCQKDQTTPSPMEIVLQGLGAFPGHQRPKVLWAGIGGDLEAIATLQEKVQLACRPFVEKPDAKPFSPHLTLARIKDGDGRLGRAVRRLAKAESETTLGAWSATDLRLVKSVQGQDRSRYSEVASVALGSLK